MTDDETLVHFQTRRREYEKLWGPGSGAYWFDEADDSTTDPQLEEVA